jgi:hypothetical protein
MQETNSSDTPPSVRPDTGVSASDPNPAEQEGQETLSFGQMLTSTLWAALGVQNKKNRERDFSRGKATHFIFFGIGFTILFVLGMYTLVRLVLSGTA